LKRIVVLLSFVSLSLAAADSLDFGRQAVVVVSMTSAGAVQQPDAGLTASAVSVLRAASYDRTQSVSTWLTSHPLAQRRLDRMAWSGRKSGTSFLSDGTVSTVYEFPIPGPVLNVLLPRTGGGRLLGRTACPCCGQPWPEGKEPPPGVQLVPDETGVSSVYTGILIDVRGLNCSRALFPTVVNESDAEVVGPGFILPERLAASGAVVYYRDRAAATASDRIGSNPLVIRALRMTGANNCDAVVSQYDAARIHGTRANLELMANCKVGFLVD
jgi:hypothetical protein